MKKILFFIGILIIASFGGAVTALAYKTYDAATFITTTNENTGVVNGFDNQLPILDWEKKRERINILLIGIDRRPGYDPAYSLTDSIIVASIDPVEKRVMLISLPRDLEVRYRSSEVKINTVHVYGREDGNRGAGPAALKGVVSEILGLDIHYFARIDFYGFRRVIDELGGITVDVPKAVIDYSYPTDDYGYTTVKINTGLNTFDGDMALKYSRVRHGSSDLDRAERQQQVIVAAKEKAISSSMSILTDPTELAGFLEILKDNFLTDIQIKEMLALSDLAKEIDTTDSRAVTSIVIGSPYIYHVPKEGKGWRFYPRDPSWNSIRNYIAEMLDDPFLQEDLQSENALIRLENGSATPGIANEIGANLASEYPLNFQTPEKADRSDYLEVVIYDLSKGNKPRTIEFLENYFSTEAQVPQNIDPNDQAEIVVILGEEAVGL